MTAKTQKEIYQILREDRDSNDDRALCLKHHISQQQLIDWRKKHGGIVARVKEMFLSDGSPNPVIAPKEPAKGTPEWYRKYGRELPHMSVGYDDW